MTAFCPTQSLPAGLASRGHDGKPLVRATFNGVSDGIRTHDIQDHNNAVRQHRTPKPLLYRDFWSADGHDHTRREPPDTLSSAPFLPHSRPPRTERLLPLGVRLNWPNGSMKRSGSSTNTPTRTVRECPSVGGVSRPLFSGSRLPSCQGPVRHAPGLVAGLAGRGTGSGSVSGWRG